MSDNVGRRKILLLAGVLLIALAGALLLASADSSLETSRRFFGLWRTRYFAGACALLLAAAFTLLAAISRGALLRGVVSLSAFGLTWGLLELVGFTGLVSWQGLLEPRLSEIGTKVAPNVDVVGVTTQDTATRWGLPSDPIPFRYQTDRRGFRNDVDYADANVVLLGDSMLVAALLPFDQTVTARLQQALAEPVISVALIGLGPQAEQDLFRTSGIDPRGKLVLQFIYEGNDLLDSREYRQRLASVGAAAPTPGFWKSTLLKQVELRLQGLTQPTIGLARTRTCRIDGQLYTFARTRDSFAGLEGELGEIERSTERFAAEVRAGGGRFAVVFVPSKLRVLGPICVWPPESELTDQASNLSPAPGELARWSAATGTSWIDLTPALSVAAEHGKIPWLWGDTHWSAAGHEAAAGALADWIATSAADPRPEK